MLWQRDAAQGTALVEDTTVKPLQRGGQTDVFEAVAVGERILTDGGDTLGQHHAAQRVTGHKTVAGHHGGRRRPADVTQVETTREWLVEQGVQRRRQMKVGQADTFAQSAAAYGGERGREVDVGDKRALAKGILVELADKERLPVEKHRVGHHDVALIDVSSLWRLHYGNGMVGSGEHTQVERVMAGGIDKGGALGNSLVDCTICRWVPPQENPFYYE